jgi:hypothetical protein
MMYTIRKLLNGKYLCECRIQDGTERWECDTLKDATNELKRAAKSLNNQTIKKRDIGFLQEVQRTVSIIEYVPLM